MRNLTTALAACAVALSGCGGMNRAVGVLPNTLDDLGRKREAVHGTPAPAPASAPGVSDPPPLPVSAQ